jgi:hypothetical protein
MPGIAAASPALTDTDPCRISHRGAGSDAPPENAVIRADWLTRMQALVVVVAFGCWPLPGDRVGLDPSFDRVGEFAATAHLLDYVLMAFSTEPSDSALQQAVVEFWAAAGARVTSAAKLACYPWDGTYSGSGSPNICRYTVVFSNREANRETVEAGFDNDHADHWYLTTAFGTGRSCVGCPPR